MIISKYKVGDWVIVRSKDEILSTLDKNGELDGMPFMATMLQFCGKRYRVLKSAHKSCDTVNSTGVRTIDSAVHLDELRCDGSTFGGCQAGCLLYWKDAWLKPVEFASDSPASGILRTAGESACTEATLIAACTKPDESADEPRYVCQATEHPVFSQLMRTSGFREYALDYSTGNVRVSEMVEPIFFKWFNELVNSGLGFGTPLRLAYSLVQKIRRKTPYPWQKGKVTKGGRTPTETLNIQPGEWVRIKTFEEILETLNEEYKNRGMAFHAELAYYCGGTFQVASRVDKIINEQTGRMMHFKNPCLVLKGTDCVGRFSKPLFCPRGGFMYWREVWLEKADGPSTTPRQVSCPAAQLQKCGVSHG